MKHHSFQWFSLSCLSEQRIFMWWFFINRTTVLVSLLSHIQILQATKNAALSFEPLPSCVNHCASECHLGHVTRTTLWPPFPPLSPFPPVYVSVVFHSNNLIIWNPTMTFGTHCVLWQNNPLLSNACQTLPKSWSSGARQGIILPGNRSCMFKRTHSGKTVVEPLDMVFYILNSVQSVICKRVQKAVQ
jgi:hypothetical protein